MTPTLLIPINMFAGDTQSLLAAARLAQLLGARLVLLYLHRHTASGPECCPEKGPLSNQKPQALTRALDSLVRTLPVPAVAEIGVGRPEKVVQDALQRHRPVLIVLTRPPETVPSDALPTVTLLNLLRISRPYPLLVVPPGTPATTLPQRVLLAADGERFSLGEPGNFVRELLGALHAHLTVAHVTESATQHTAPRALGSVARTGLTRDLPEVHTYHTCSAQPATGILQAVQEQQADLLLVVARPHTFLWELFQRGVTAQLVVHSPIPVLVLPTEQEARALGSRSATLRTHFA